MSFDDMKREARRVVISTPARHVRVLALSSMTAAMLAACGGGSGDASAPQAAGDNADRRQAEGAKALTTNHADAFRLLTQASFGPTDATVSNVMSTGISGWIDAQEALPVRANYLARWNSDNAALAANGGATPQTVDSSFYQAAMANDDQLRERVAYALSQIFVVSMQDLALAGPKSQTSASYMDMLNQDAFGNFRSLLNDVAMHPAMGQYLSTLGNAKEAPKIGRIPDQNFAREVMQLFTIGLVQLNLNGTPKLVNGQPVPTYGPADIDGLSRVFTGFSWAGPDTSKQRFYSTPGYLADNRLYTAMQAYPQYHSTSEKDFLGAVVPAQGTPDPAASLNTALDTLFNHPNVGPFISKQLIQRLVTSNPSPAYVARVATVFNNDGTGARGNMKAVVKTILTDTEARDPAKAATPGFGKVKEPVLRLTAFLRAYNATSDSNLWLIGSTDDPGVGLAQSPLRSETVFNFYRPGYVSAGGATAANGLVAPEMQITTETSVAGYANFMMGVVQRGVGMKGLLGTASRNDVQPDFSAAQNLATDSASLVNDVTARLIGDTVDASLKSQIQTAVDSIPIPALNKAGSNGPQIENAKHNRVLTAVLLTLASPEYIAQK
jgi:uncharacterized protein (DUF1800 family)